MVRSLVLGGSGQIGRFLIPKLLDCGHEVIALSRRPRDSGQESLRWVRGDLFSAMPEFGPLDSIFSLGPLNGFANWIEHAQVAGNPRLVALGSMSVLSKRDSADARERDLARTLQQAEQQLADAANRKDLDWTLLRPTLIYGAGLDRSLTPLARLGMRWRVFPKFPAATGLRQPVHAEDLADACLAASQEPLARKQTYDLGGGEQLSFAEMMSRVRASLPRSTLGISLSFATLRAALHLARLRPQWRGITTQAIERLKRDLVADDQLARSHLGWSPRSFRPVAATWSDWTLG
ncbi:NAD-dependent epimerase/dehydratase family protein [Dokdonella sp.]|uniref:NAD-dependent epimerase/dehydratase family protein n=1 Tax=Dokdonella sp. TaxID=2291710 RepID=UPI0035284D50